MQVTVEPWPRRSSFSAHSYSAGLSLTPCLTNSACTRFIYHAAVTHIDSARSSPTVSSIRSHTMKSLSFLAVGLFSGALAATVSQDATCGGTNKYTCLGSQFGNCCSSAGWCGSTTAYCGTGCQSGFGNCGSNNGPSSTVASSTKAPSSTKASSATPAPSASGSATQCLSDKKVPYKVSADAAYAQLAEPYNLRLPYKPAVIVLPTTNQHVQDAVVCGGKAGLKIQAKSGGHSYASFSSGGKDGSMGKYHSACHIVKTVANCL